MKHLKSESDTQRAHWYHSPENKSLSNLEKEDSPGDQEFAIEKGDQVHMAVHLNH